MKRPGLLAAVVRASYVPGVYIRSGRPIDAADIQPAAAAKADTRVKVLRRLPGVGPLTALTILAEVGDVTRFAHARKLLTRAYHLLAQAQADAETTA